MAHIVQVPGFSDERGELHVLQDNIPFDIKRVYYIHGKPDVVRGGHRHRTSVQALICLHGSCVVSNNNGNHKHNFILDDPGTCLILEPQDWHTMHSFTENAVLLVLASTKYDVNDYIDESYPEY